MNFLRHRKRRSQNIIEARRYLDKHFLAEIEQYFGRTATKLFQPDYSAIRNFHCVRALSQHLSKFLAQKTKSVDDLFGRDEHENSAVILVSKRASVLGLSDYVYLFKQAHELVLLSSDFLICFRAGFWTGLWARFWTSFRASFTRRIH